MALGNSSKTPGLSQLSAEAVSFIPFQPGQAVVLDSCANKTGNLTIPMPAMVPQAAKNLPGYVMNCYPFVDPDVSARFQANRLSVASGHADRKTGSDAMQQKTISEGTNFFVDIQCPPPVNSVMTPQFLSHRINPPIQIPYVNTMPTIAQPVSGHTQGPPVIPMSAPPPFPAPHGYLGVPSAMYGFNRSIPFMPGVQLPSQLYSSTNQVQAVWPPQSKPEDKALKTPARTKVIVCKDNFAQTDFNDKLAQLTLAEEPNTLYIKDQVSQDVDSDSGYSSPLHRKNQTSTAVQPSCFTTSHQPMPNPGPVSPYPATNTAIQGSHDYNVVPSFSHPVYPFVIPSTYQYPQIPGINYSAQLPFYGPGFSPLCSRPEVFQSQFMGTGSFNNQHRFRGKQKPGLTSTGARPPGEVVRDNSKWKPASVSASVVTMQREVSDGSSAPLPSCDREVRLPFEDEDEFPILLSAAGGLVAHGECFNSSALTYGEILRSPSVQVTSRSRRSSASSSDKRRNANSLPTGMTPGAMISGFVINKDSKSSRKKQKRQLMAQQAAEEELAEISLEQQMLKELSTKQQKKQLLSATEKTPVSVSLSTQCPAALQIVTVSTVTENSVTTPALFDVMDEMGQLEKEAKLEEDSETLQVELKSVSVGDLTGLAKRCKDREFPNRKKPSSLKRVILKEREAKNRHNLLDGCTSSVLSDGTVDFVNNESSMAECNGLTEPLAAPALTSAEMSPVSQMSPINMSPLSGSPAGSAGASPIAGEGTLGSGRSSILSKIHSRRFREYCNQVLDKEIDDCCTELLQDLVAYQDRCYQDDPFRAKSKRRFVLGLREVTKHLKLGKLKCVIISPNLERIQSKGGLDEALNAIIEMSQKQDVPFVFALGRRALGRACAKLVPVSVVGLFSYEGSEENFFKLRDLTQKAREAYAEMVSSLEREMASAEPPATNTITTAAGSFEKLFPHLGHSRTPSACSAISFISSILSEPISENYPQSEPETDSRGYEIRHENRKPDLDTVGEGREETVESDAEEKNATLPKKDFDDGHEADTEEDGLCMHQGFGSKTNTGTRDPKDKSKAISESEARHGSDMASSLDLSVAALNPVDAVKLEARNSAIVIGPPDSETKDLPLADQIEVPVQVPMITSEKSERIESWVAESQRVTKQLRELSSSEVTSAAAPADEVSGEEGEDEEGDNDDDEDAEEIDDAASLKSIDDSSSSQYEETTDAPFGHIQSL